MQIQINKFLITIFICHLFVVNIQAQWNSKYVYFDEQGILQYLPDEKGNIIPDFGKVGYHKGETPPVINVVETVSPGSGDDLERIQDAINRVAALAPDAQGFRGCILLKKGTYQLSEELKVTTSGIVIRGEGDNENGTVLVATGTKQYHLLSVRGSGEPEEITGTRVKINQSYVPVGTKEITLQSVQGYSIGDKIILYRPGTTNWIHDLKMDQLPPKSDGTPSTQWTPEKYTFRFERVIEKISGNTITIDQPVVMAMEDKYGGGYVYKYTYAKRISHCGVEDILMKSDYTSETDEDHGWRAIYIRNVENGWVRNVTSKYFGYALVEIKGYSSYISILDCTCLDPKSKITGGRRYSFSVNGQMCLVANCTARNGRHDFVAGVGVAGPNVFTRCKATKTHADIGPHHRWVMGALYDVIETDGDINVQDRGNSGTGHGWAGVNHVLWNCEARKICVQSPWVSGKNYSIGCRGQKTSGRLSGRPDGVWEGKGETNLAIESLYEAQKKPTASAIQHSNKTDNSLNLTVCPNPFTNSTLIKFNLHEYNYVVITIHNSSGQVIQTLLTQVSQFQKYNKHW